MLHNIKCFQTANTAKRKTLPNIKCFQTSNATKRQTLQNVKHCQLSNATKHQMLPNIKCFQTSNVKRCQTSNTTNRQTLPNFKRFQTSNAANSPLTKHWRIWCQQPNLMGPGTEHFLIICFSRWWYSSMIAHLAAVEGCLGFEPRHPAKYSTVKGYIKNYNVCRPESYKRKWDRTKCDYCIVYSTGGTVHCNWL